MPEPWSPKFPVPCVWDKCTQKHGKRGVAPYSRTTCAKPNEEDRGCPEAIARARQQNVCQPFTQTFAAPAARCGVARCGAGQHTKCLVPESCIVRPCNSVLGGVRHVGSCRWGTRCSRGECVTAFHLSIFMNFLYEWAVFLHSHCVNRFDCKVEPKMVLYCDQDCHLFCIICWILTVVQQSNTFICAQSRNGITVHTKPWFTAEHPSKTLDKHWVAL